MFKHIKENDIVKDSRGFFYTVDLVQGAMFRAFNYGIKENKVFSSVWNFRGAMISYNEPLDISSNSIYLVEICTPNKYPELFL